MARNTVANSDDQGLHRMGNASDTEQAVTLHQYIPPFDFCHAFDDENGRKTKCDIVFHTKYGEKVGDASQ